MEAALRQFLEAGLAPSTQKVYAAGWNRYTSFTRSFNLVPTPVTSEKAILFVAFLGTQGLSLSTIESYLSALRHVRLTSSPSDHCPSLHSPQMSLLLRGIRRTQSQPGPRLVRLPMTPTLMRRIKSSLATQARSYGNILLWAACCVGFFGFLRCGEFLVPDSATFDPHSHLSLHDISLDTSASCWVIMLYIKTSKTDQFHQGCSVALGSTGSDLCPVAALLDYLAVRGKAAGPLFQLENGQPLKRRTFTTQVQQALTASGVNGSLFNGHSFRIGAATAASAAGVPETTIKLLGRWQSSAYQQYIRTPPSDLAHISRQLVEPDYSHSP